MSYNISGMAADIVLYSYWDRWGQSVWTSSCQVGRDIRENRANIYWELPLCYVPEVFYFILSTSKYYGCWLCVLSRVWCSVTPWNVARKVPLLMEFFRQGYWSGLSFPSPEDLPNPGTELESLAFPVLAGRFLTNCATWVLIHFSRVQLFVTLWTIALLAPLSMGFSRQEYWSGCCILSPWELGKS